MDIVCSSSESLARSLTDLLKGILDQIKVFRLNLIYFWGVV